MPDSQEIIIEEYVPAKHAASIAEMWNRSSESWGGDGSYRTEESVLREHENSPMLKLFLAVSGSEVIGYCSFSHYKEDTGALYIPLLNVRPDYHGRKVGKRLVRRAVEETIRLGWPRLDLYTWPGNVKAVPTYKKSGFFWENRDDTTHLMNFIPSVLQTGAVKSYFGQIDWYNDSIREIIVQPDGHGEGGFDYFTYEWVKDGLALRMEYERTGRGLRLIETEDYRIQATIPAQHELPFGAEYPVIYEAVNKSGKPLSLAIAGKSNEQIRFELNEVRDVESEARVEGSFFVHPVKEEQDLYQTHPVVEAELLINGLPAVFKLGIKPKFPVKVKFQVPDRAVFAGEEVELDVTVENAYSKDAVFAFELPEDAILAFGQESLTLEVPAKGRRTVTVKARLLAYGIWNHTVNVRHAQEGLDSVILEQELSLVFPGAEAAFGGQTDKDYIISNGRYSAVLNKTSQFLAFLEGREYILGLPYPKLGLPYTNEFKKLAALDVKHYREQEAIVLEASYGVSIREGLLLTMVVKLHGNGICSRHFRIHNQLDTDQEEELILKDSFQFSLHGGVIPYNGKYLDLSLGAEASDSDYWDVRNFHENWMFAADGERSRGISWPAELELIQESWLHAVEHSLGRLPARGQQETSPLRIALGTWDHWQDFRAYALQRGNEEDLNTGQQLEVSLNHGNPFISGHGQLTLQEQKKSYLAGEISISSRTGSIEATGLTVQEEQKLGGISLPLTRSSSTAVDVLTLHLDMDSYVLDQSYLILPVSEEPVRQERLEVGQSQVLAVDNGLMRIQASPDFAPGLFSLTHQGQEWLDSSFPQPVAKSWWNPWVGGIMAGVEGIALRSFMEEPRTADFAELTDNKGNRWSGIRISVTIGKNDNYKGLVLHQYFMLLPGVPILVSTVHVEQNTGRTLYPLKLETSTLYRAASEIAKSRGYIKRSSGEELVYKAGRVQTGDRSTNGLLQLGSTERQQRLTLVTASKQSSPSLMVSADVVLSNTEERLYLQDSKEQFSKPQFYLISDLQAPEQAYADLRTIRFGK
ncbi:GNAT family N-acetyltransferase [Paenibacillus tritici]|uniref:GNAT family N-acetyltransferase n=1 Tax=Paenibacillus tritici TaxID=1873425 RepID=UPI001BAA9317|nr:GNAT family N-acetyltransferase [Paenibacillus tritici]QUL57868.1 GNAT family N-acetyltransferase [Paenibacillus tritici]